MITINNLSVEINGKQVLNNINIDFKLGKNYAILGKNGSGKSSLFLTCLKHPHYNIVSGDIKIENQSIKNLLPSDISKLGVFLAFQKIPEIPGVKLFDFLKAIYNAHLPNGSEPVRIIPFKKLLLPILEQLNIPKDFLFRDLNVGFSGGEKRKIEILQIILLKPKYIIMDEIDSGLDINSIKYLGNLLKSLNNNNNCFIITSHYLDILNYMPPNEVFIMEEGTIKEKGTRQILNTIKNKGF